MIKRFAIFALTAGVALSAATPAFSGDKPRKQPSQHYVPASGDIIDLLFGGPRYYDNRMITTGAGPCAYDPVGPDANAANVVNDKYCGK